MPLGSESTVRGGGVPTPYKSMWNSPVSGLSPRPCSKQCDSTKLRGEDQKQSSGKTYGNLGSILLLKMTGFNFILNKDDGQSPKGGC